MDRFHHGWEVVLDWDTVFGQLKAIDLVISPIGPRQQ